MIFISNFISKEAAEFWIERNKSEFTDFSITEVDEGFRVDIKLNSDYDDIDDEFEDSLDDLEFDESDLDKEDM